MASTVVACPLCAAPLAVPPELAGQAIACPVCTRQIRLPEAPAAEAAVDISTVVATAPPHRQRTAARRSTFPIGIALSWIAIAGLAIFAGVLVYRERAKRMAEAEAPPAVAPAPIVTVQPKAPKKTPPAAASNPATKSEGEKKASSKPAAEEKTAPEPSPKPKAAQAKPPAKQPPPKTPSAAAKAPPQVAPVRDVWQLPPLAASSPEPLETLKSDPSDSFELTMRSTAANLPAKAAIYAETADSRAWTVWYVADLDAPEGRAALGTIRRDGQELSFAWTQPFADSDIRRQVANCQVELREGAATRFIQLREKVAQPRLSLDLSDDRQTVEFPLADLPKQANLRLEIRDLAGFPGGTSIRSETKSIALGKSAIVEFAELPGAEIELRFLRPSASGNLVLRVEPVFKEKKIREYELSLKNLNQVETKVKHSRDEDREKLKQAQTNLVAAQRDVSAIKANPPSSSATPLQRNLYARTLGAAIGRASELEDKIRLLQEQIRRSDERLKAVPKMRTFIQSIHSRATISYQLIAECGGRDLVLVDGTRAM